MKKYIKFRYRECDVCAEVLRYKIIDKSKIIGFSLPLINEIACELRIPIHLVKIDWFDYLWCKKIDDNYADVKFVFSKPLEWITEEEYLANEILES